MPILLLRVGWRVIRALATTAELFLDAQARRAFPWRYVWRLPRENFAVALLMLTLTGSLLTALVALGVPSQHAGTGLAWVAVGLAALGILSGWLRQLRLWLRLRR